MGIKLNLGASPNWKKKGWCVLDHKLKCTEHGKISGDAVNMQLDDKCCDIVFCSHVFEHIPHVKLPLVIAEINRVMQVGGVLRILTPDLEVIARAYVNRDEDFFRKVKEEDQNIRMDLGLGGALVNFIVGPGQDTILLNRDMSEFIAGYSHLYIYDYEMLSIILSKLGFTNIVRSPFQGSTVGEMREPVHVTHLPPVWQSMNDEFYCRHKLTHKMIDGKYIIDFKITGFDRDPLTSLIVECVKSSDMDKKTAHAIFNESHDNYNRYAYSLLFDESVRCKFDKHGIRYNSEK